MCIAAKLNGAAPADIRQNHRLAPRKNPDAATFGAAYVLPMASRTPISQLEDEERRAHIRLAAFRARLLRRDGSAIAYNRRLRELERQYKGAVERLRRERQR